MEPDTKRIQIKRTRWKRIKKIQFDVDTSNGNFLNDYYTVKMALKNIPTKRKLRQRVVVLKKVSRPT